MTTVPPEPKPSEPALTYTDIARRQARPPLLRRENLRPSEALLSLLLFAPVPLWAAGGGSPLGEKVLVVTLALAALLALLLRRMPTPVPSASMLPVGLVWAVAVLLLPGGALALTCGFLAGVVLVLYVALPAAGELPPLATMVAAQVAIPALGGALALLVAIALLGFVAPLYSVVLLPTLGALALAVYLFSKEEGLAGGEERPEGGGSSPSTGAQEG